MLWTEIALPWQICLEEAWTAYCAGTVPIGAAIFGPDGQLLSRARNHIRDDDAPPGQISRHDLAHAEMNALLQISRRTVDTHACTLYTAVEPCPLCMGAIYMMGIYDVRFAARDAYAGSTNLLKTTPYLCRKPVVAQGPQPALEDAIIILLTASHIEMGYEVDRCPALYGDWRSVSEHAVQRGIELAGNGEMRRAAGQGLSARAAFEILQR